MERFDGNYLDDEDLIRLHNEQHSHQQQDEQHDPLGQHSQQAHHEIQTQTHQPSQTIVDEAELLAAQAAAEAAAAQQQQHPGGAFHNVGQGLTGKYRDMIMEYWQETINSIEHDEHDFKNHQLPLARIKKVMKTDEDVRMISAEAPILFAKGCDVFITELTMRAWIHAEENKRRTLQKSDIAAALTKSDMFDFLIDVVPREEEKPKKASYSQSRSESYIGSTLPPQADMTTVPKLEDNKDLLKQEDSNDDSSHQDFLQLQIMQQQLLQQQMMQPQQQSQQSQLQQLQQLQPPLPHSLPPPVIPQIQNQLPEHVELPHLPSNGSIANNSTDSNFANFQNFHPTDYNNEF